MNNIKIISISGIKWNAIEMPISKEHNMVRHRNAFKWNNMKCHRNAYK